jgi:hypothetical protein
MIKILINGEPAYGLITFNIKYENGVLVKDGLLKTHLYVEEIDTLSCSKFALTGIDVQAESFGSNDKFNLYYFTYEDYQILDDGSKISEEELMRIYENELKK